MHLPLILALLFTLACDSKTSEAPATETTVAVAATKSKSIDAAPTVETADASVIATTAIPDAARVVVLPPDAGRKARRNKDEQDEQAKIQEAIESAAIMAVLTGGGGSDTYAEGGNLPTLKSSISMAGGGTGSNGSIGPQPSVQPNSRLNVTVQSVKRSITPSKDEVQKRIRAKYSSALKRCHQRSLKTDPKTAGTVVGTFVIGPSGRATSSSFTGVEKTLSACIQSMARRWRFPAPQTAQGAPTEADVKLTLIFGPG